MHHTWCVHGDPERPRGFRGAFCGRCPLVVLTLAVWAQVDPEAFAITVDPNGIQRAWITAKVLPELANDRMRAEG